MDIQEYDYKRFDLLKAVERSYKLLKQAEQRSMSERVMRQRRVLFAMAKDEYREYVRENNITVGRESL